MKFAIGTAQFIPSYGILKKKINTIELGDIFSNIHKDINAIDTAPSYGRSHKFIGKFANKKYKILTKISEISHENNYINFKKIEKEISKSKKDLKDKKIDTIFFHNEKNIKLMQSCYFRKKFLKICKLNNIKNIGISIYDINKLHKYLKIHKFDIIQIPMNVFNINKIKIEKLRKLKKKYNFKIYARSVFFQGLIFKDISDIQNKFKFLKKKIKLLGYLKNKYKTSLLNISLSALENVKIIDYAIVGITCKNDFIDILKYKKTKISKKEIFKLYINDNKTDLRKY